MSNDLLSQARAFHHALDIPREVWDALSKNESAANIILPFAKKALTLPREDDDKQLWIALFDESNNVAFVLSCTKGPLGNYPIFIVSCGSSSIEIADAMSALVSRLLQKVPPDRVFSVFSTAKVARVFTGAFEAQVREEHGIRAHETPYYEAAFSSCTKDTIVHLTFPPPDEDDVTPGPIMNLRLASISDLEGVKRLCQGFSETSVSATPLFMYEPYIIPLSRQPPYELGDAAAELEARTMIENKQVWVHIIRQADQEEIACLVATTRESANVTAVTKVFTAEKWRGRRCALRLLHRICHEWVSFLNVSAP